MSVNEKMTAIANAIRRNGGGQNKLTLDDMPIKIDEVCDIQFSVGNETGYEMGHKAGSTESLEYAEDKLQEILAMQDIYLAEDISIYIMNMTDYESKEVICNSTDTWAKIIADDYNGVVSFSELAIGSDNYVRYGGGLGGYLYSDDGSYCKADGKPVANMSYRPNGTAPTE